MLENFRIRTKIIDQNLPRKRRRKQPMNEEDWNLVGIVGVNQVDTCGEPWMVGSQERA